MAHKWFSKQLKAGMVTVALCLGAAQPASADITKHFSKYAANSTVTVDHAAWDKLLQSYVVPGDDGLNRVRYSAFKAADHGTLKQYVAALEGVRPSTLSRPEQYAYWANLYNAKTIDVVLDAYPVASIREITINPGVFDLIKRSVGAGGPWKAKIMRVEGQQLSLDDVEHGIMRPIFKDPRVHYAVNCASVGCPNLQTVAFTGANLETVLDAGARAFVNSPRGFVVEGGDIVASSIYNWFQVDFGGDAAGVLRHAAKYAEPDLRQKLSAAKSIADYRYDWSLNDVR